MKYTFAYVKEFGKSNGINVQKINYKSDGINYRYELFKTGAVVIECSTLEETMSEIYYWNPENK